MSRPATLILPKPAADLPAAAGTPGLAYVESLGPTAHLAELLRILERKA